jgi:hypothetical protein
VADRKKILLGEINLQNQLLKPNNPDTQGGQGKEAGLVQRMIDGETWASGH